MISNDLEVLINWNFPPLYYAALWSKDRSAVAALISAAVLYILYICQKEIYDCQFAHAKEPDKYTVNYTNQGLYRSQVRSLPCLVSH